VAHRPREAEIYWLTQLGMVSFVCSTWVGKLTFVVKLFGVLKLVTPTNAQFNNLYILSIT